MKTIPPSESGPDFDKYLPKGRDYFSVPELAKLWDCVPKHVHNLIDAGELVAASIEGKRATKTMRRIPRASVVDFLNRRKNQ